MLLLAVFGSAILYNCEPEPDSLGQQLFDKDAATGNEKAYDVIAYNINNNDSIKSDGSKLLSIAGASVAVLGVSNEGNFGMQKASYLTQLRMPTTYDFGSQPIVDSVVLVIRTPANTADDTYYLADKVKAPGAYDKDNFDIGNEKVNVSIEKKTYPVRSFGKIDGTMKINVHRVKDFLDKTASDSNVNVEPVPIGSGIFDGNVSSVTITKRGDNTKVFDGKLGFRINLDNETFQKSILDMAGKDVLKDAANFTRYFTGIKLSVEEDNGYLFQFAPNDMELHMYYKSDKTVNGTVTRSQSVLDFDLGQFNAHLGHYEYIRGNSPDGAGAAMSNANQITGDKSLFVQGMGGPSVGLKIDKATIIDLKNKFNNDKAGIVGAKIRVYVDKDKTWTNSQFVTADRRFTLLTTDKDDDKKLALLSDISKGFPVYYYGKATLKNVEYEYYDFVVTQTLKDLIENTNVVNKDLVLTLNSAAFLKNSAGAVFGANYTTRAIDMNKTVLVGVKETPFDPKNPDPRVQLKVTYSTINNK